MTARSPAASSCRRRAGSGATRCGCMARSIRTGSPLSKAASRSTASPMARSAPASSAGRAATPGSRLALREGKNREVRGVLEHLGLPVTRLIRLSFGPFQLGNLARGEVAEVPKKVLAEQLGKRRSGTCGSSAVGIAADASSPRPATRSGRPAIARARRCSTSSRTGVSPPTASPSPRRRCSTPSPEPARLASRRCRAVRPKRSSSSRTPRRSRCCGRMSRRWARAPAPRSCRATPPARRAPGCGAR